MVTGDQELQWAYLLCPTFELSNSEGKPLTNGYIELYIAGTRDKYYAASDFAGTLHPFQIPLDSLGSNIVLVSPDNAYDVYVYNRFGNLVMSRYNVVPTNGAAGGGSSSSNISINSEDGTVVVTESTDPETGVKTFDLSVPCVTGNPSYWTGRGAATMGVTISDTEYHKIDIDSHSINNNGEDIGVINGEFNLKKGVYFWNVTVQLDKYEAHDNTRQRVYIESGFNRGAYTMDMTHDESETISFSGITVADYDDTKQDIKIKSEGESPFKATLYNVSIHKLNQNILGDNGTTYTAGDYIEITEDDVINVTGLTTPEDVEAMIDAAITAVVSGDIYTGGDYINIDNHVISVTGLQPAGNYLTPEDLEGYATETYVDNSVSSFTTHTEVYDATVTAIEAVTTMIPAAQVQSDWTEEDSSEPSYIQNKPDIKDLVEGTNIHFREEEDAIYIDAVVTSFATKDEVYEAVVTGVQLATAQIPEQLEAGDYISIQNNTINVTGLQEAGDYLTPEDLEGYATEEYVTTYVDNSVSSFTNHTEVYDATVTAVQLATAQIPDPLEAGQYIDITNNIINVTGLQPAGEYLTQEDLEGYATETYVDNSVSSFATHTEVYNATVTAIEVATGAIPDSEEVEFEELDITQFAQASAIPVVTDFATHTEVYEAVVTGVQLATSMIPDLEEYATEEYVTTYVDNSVSSFTTHTEVYEATVTALETATAAIPDTEEVQFKEINLGDYALASAIPDVSNFATHTEVYEAVVTGVQLATAQIPDPLEAGQYISIEDNMINVTGLQPEGDYATHTEVYESTVTAIEHVTALIPEAQVQSDWTEADSAEPSYIQNKPEEVRLVAGDNINITETATSVVISSQGGGSTYTAGQYISIDNNEISVTGLQPEGDYATNTEVYEATVTAIEHVTGLIPAAQVQSDWIEDNTSDPSYIQNKPQEKYIVPGEGIRITESATGIVIDCTVTGGGGGGGATYTAGQNISIDSENVISVTGLAQADWAVTAIDDPAYIQNKPTEKNLIAGANVTISETNDEVTIQTTEIASGLQLVAGKGVKLTVSGNNLVAGIDETVLWNETTPVNSGSIILNEAISHFERVRFVWCKLNATDVGGHIDEISGAKNGYDFVHAVGTGNAWLQIAYITYNNTTKTLTFSSGKNINFGAFSSTSWSTPTVTSGVGDTFYISKIVGIGRISS